MNDFNTFAPDEQEDEQIIHDLRRLYPAQEEIAYHLERAKQRLYSVNDSAQNAAHPIAAAARPATSARRKTVRAEHFIPEVGAYRAWSHRLNTFAAIAAVVILVGALALVLTLARLSRPGSASHAYTKGGQQFQIMSISMIDAQTGWADCSGGVVLRTTDGGLHWKDTSPSLQKQTYYGNALFLDGLHAWVGVTASDATTKVVDSTDIFSTSDGGQSWQRATIQTDGYYSKQFSFIDAHEGWLYTRQWVSIHQVIGPENYAPPLLFHTVDGGKTWHRVLDPASSHAKIFNDVVIDDIRFHTTTDGWITGIPQHAAPHSARLYRTQDGGQTWQEQALTLSQNVSGLTEVWAPRFFTSLEGILPVIAGTPIEMTFYVTHNGGGTWQKEASLTGLTGEGGWLSLPAMLDMQHWWVKDMDHSGEKLYATTDGGKHWTTMSTPAQPNVSKLGVPDFTSEKVAWLRMYRYEHGQMQFTVLFKTTDGGHTWTEVHALFPDFIIPASHYTANGINH